MSTAERSTHGNCAPGFDKVGDVFANQLESGQEIGAAFAVYLDGQCVVDLWGGMADKDTAKTWEHDTRVQVFSVTKGLTAMAFNLLAERGGFDWDSTVASYWPEFGGQGKGGITVRMLLNHRAGLVGLNQKVTVADCVNPDQSWLEALIAGQTPFWQPDQGQGYHAITYGMYARALFERLTKDSIGTFLKREFFEPLDAQVSLGTPASLEPKIARLYTVSMINRLTQMTKVALTGGSYETRVARSILTSRRSAAREAFRYPSMRSPTDYDRPDIRRAELAWGGATATAKGLARAYLPFAGKGVAKGQGLLKEETLAPLYARQSWGRPDLVLQKELGWSQGFLKEEPHLFSPTLESFGHAGLGGALGWADPKYNLTIGYTPNMLDWRMRSPRALRLCRAVYDCLGR